MGGKGSGRRPEPKTPISTAGGEGIFIPNLSGDHSKGHTGTPANDTDIANKKYVDDIFSNITSFVTADSATLNVGTSSSVVSDLQTLLDGNSYDISEVAASPGIDLEVDFSSVTDINQIVVRAYYNGGSTHGVRVQLWNYTDSQWDTIYTFSTATDFQQQFKSIPDDANYVSSGNARVRFYHTEMGNASHDLFIDWCALAKGTSPLSLRHSDLTAGIGTNTHDQIDTHIDDATKHFTEASINHNAITNLNMSVAGHVVDVNLDMNNFKLTELGAPTVDTDAATKKYVDDNDHAAVTVTDTSSIDLTLTGQDIQGAVLPAGVDHDSLLNFVSNEHIDWTNATQNLKTTGTGTIVGNTVVSGTFTASAGTSFQKHDASTPTRALNTTYQNTTGHPIIVYGSVVCVYEQSTDLAYIDVKTDSSSPPTTVVQQVGVTLHTDNAETGEKTKNYGFFMVVQNNDYYRIDKTENNLGTVALDPANWQEVDF